MPPANTILSSVVKKITPTKKEEKEIALTIGEVERVTRNSIGKLTHTIAGSFTRNTWMRDKKEFDIFILFPENTQRKTLEKKGLLFGKKIVKQLKGTSIVAYAEHPYTRATYRGFSIDIVPCYKITNTADLKSSVDRTPFHNQYLATNFPLTLSKEVRLLKQFLKANNLYGSDTRTLGFSGYLCELLTLHYKSFKNLAKHASKWTPGEVFVDIENHQPIKPTQFNSHPLVVIDPVDPKRNVAAVVSTLNFLRFTDLCRRFTENSSEKFFFKKLSKSKNIPSKLAKRRTQILVVEFAHPGIIDDILYPQLRRSSSRLRNLLQDYEFSVLWCDVFAGNKKCLLLFEMEVHELPSVRKVIGPPVFVRKHSKEFLSKYSKDRLWVEGDRWTAEVSRKFTLAETLLKTVLKNKPKKLRQSGIASSIAISLNKGFKILKNPDINKKAKEKEFSFFLQNYLERRIEV